MWSLEFIMGIIMCFIILGLWVRLGKWGRVRGESCKFIFLGRWIILLFFFLKWRGFKDITFFIVCFARGYLLVCVMCFLNLSGYRESGLVFDLFLGKK